MNYAASERHISLQLRPAKAGVRGSHNHWRIRRQPLGQFQDEKNVQDWKSFRMSESRENWLFSQTFRNFVSFTHDPEIMELPLPSDIEENGPTEKYSAPCHLVFGGFSRFPLPFWRTLSSSERHY
jgi:hypothetical protein